MRSCETTDRASRETEEHQIKVFLLSERGEALGLFHLEIQKYYTEKIQTGLVEIGWFSSV